jgi:hypothetical protein
MHHLANVAPRYAGPSLPAGGKRNHETGIKGGFGVRGRLHDADIQRPKPCAFCALYAAP